MSGGIDAMLGGLNMIEDAMHKRPEAKAVTPCGEFCPEFWTQFCGPCDAPNKTECLELLSCLQALRRAIADICGACEVGK